MNCLKKIKKILIMCFILVLMMGLTLIFSSCDEIREVILIKVEQISGTSEYKVGEFEYSDYQLVVYYDKGDPSKYTLSEKMLPASEQMKLFKEGEQTIGVEYSNLTDSFTVTFKRNSFEGITLEDKTFKYDGSAKYLEVTGELPSGTEVIYVGNGNISCGTYDVTCCLTHPTYASKWLDKAVMTIEKGDYYIGTETIANANILKDVECTYDGNSHTIAVDSTLPEGVTVSYSISKDGGTKEEGNSAKEAGEYTITASFKTSDSLNYNTIPDKTATLTINKADYEVVYSTEMAALKGKFNDQTISYDGKNHSIQLDSGYVLPKGVSVSYSVTAKSCVKTFDGKNVVDVGEYEFSANFTGDSKNYLPITPLKATLKINKQVIKNESLVYDDQEYVYTGSPCLTQIFEENYDVNYSVEYIITKDGNVISSAIDVGTYVVEAKFTYKKSDDYENGDPDYDANFSLYSNLEITKATINKVFAFESKYFEYTGEEQTIVITSEDLDYIPNIAPVKDEQGNYIPFIDSVIYTNNKQTNVGSYSVCASFVLNDVYEDNFNAPSQINSTFVINKLELTNNTISEIFDSIVVESAYTGEDVKCVIESVPAYISFGCEVNSVSTDTEKSGNNVSFTLGVNAGDYDVKFTNIEINLGVDSDNIINMVSVTEYSKVVTIDKAEMPDDKLSSIVYKCLGNEVTSLPYSYNEVKEMTVSGLPSGLTLSVCVNNNEVEYIGNTFTIGSDVGIYNIELTYSMANYQDKKQNMTFEITKGKLTGSEFSSRLLYTTDVEDGNKTFVYLNDQSKDLFEFTLKVDDVDAQKQNDKYIIGVNVGTYTCDYVVTLTSAGLNLYDYEVGNSLAYTEDYEKQKTEIVIVCKTTYGRYKNNGSCTLDQINGTVSLSGLPSCLHAKYCIGTGSYYYDYTAPYSVPYTIDGGHSATADRTVRFKFNFTGDEVFDNYDIKFINLTEGTVVSESTITSEETEASVVCKTIDVTDIQVINPEEFNLTVNYNYYGYPYLYINFNGKNEYNAFWYTTYNSTPYNQGTKKAYIDGDTSRTLSMNSSSGDWYVKYKLSSSYNSLTFTFGYDLLEENTTTLALDSENFYVISGSLTVTFDGEGKAVSAVYTRASDGLETIMEIEDVTSY